MLSPTAGSLIDVRLELLVWKNPLLVGVSRGVVVAEEEVWLSSPFTVGGD